MGKVICFYTRDEIKGMPATKEEGELLIQQLLEFELSRSDNPFVGSVSLIENMISMVENNTGASRYDVMDRIYGESRA